MKKTLRIALVTGLVGTAMSLATTATAAPRQRAGLPAGYSIVESPVTAAPHGVQTHGSARCPGALRPAGGGADVASGSTSVALGSSYPNGRRWAVNVNNASANDTTFTVYAVCVTPGANYKVVSSLTTANAGSQTLGAAFCSRHTRAIGGGVHGISSSTGLNIEDNFPDQLGSPGVGWDAYVVNASGSTSSFKVFAVCETEPAGYSIQGTFTGTAPPNSQTETSAGCPGASVPLAGGGGAQIQNDDLLVTMNTSFPTGQNWIVWENNGEPRTYDTDAEVVCAGT